MTRFARATLPLLVLLGLAACETVEGAGEDVSNAGRALNNQAEESQAEMQ